MYRRKIYCRQLLIISLLLSNFAIILYQTRPTYSLQTYFEFEFDLYRYIPKKLKEAVSLFAGIKDLRLNIESRKLGVDKTVFEIEFLIRTVSDSGLNISAEIEKTGNTIELKEISGGGYLDLPIMSIERFPILGGILHKILEKLNSKLKIGLYTEIGREPSPNIPHGYTYLLFLGLNPKVEVGFFKKFDDYLAKFSLAFRLHFLIKYEQFKLIFAVYPQIKFSVKLLTFKLKLGPFDINFGLNKEGEWYPDINNDSIIDVYEYAKIDLRSGNVYFQILPGNWVKLYDIPISVSLTNNDGGGSQSISSNGDAPKDIRSPRDLGYIYFINKSYYVTGTGDIGDIDYYKARIVPPDKKPSAFYIDVFSTSAKHRLTIFSPDFSPYESVIQENYSSGIALPTTVLSDWNYTLIMGVEVLETTDNEKSWYIVDIIPMYDGDSNQQFESNSDASENSPYEIIANFSNDNFFAFWGSCSPDDVDLYLIDITPPISETLYVYFRSYGGKISAYIMAPNGDQYRYLDNLWREINRINISYNILRKWNSKFLLKIVGLGGDSTYRIILTYNRSLKDIYENDGGIIGDAPDEKEYAINIGHEIYSCKLSSDLGDYKDWFRVIVPTFYSVTIYISKLEGAGSAIVEILSKDGKTLFKETTNEYVVFNYFANETTELFVLIRIDSAVDLEYTISVYLEPDPEQQFDGGQVGDAGNTIYGAREIYNGRYSGIFLEGLDTVDWYVVPINTSGIIVIKCVPQGIGQLDLYVYDKNGDLVSIGENISNYARLARIISYAPNIYYIQVTLQYSQKPLLEYTLEVSLASLNITDYDVYPGLDAGDAPSEATIIGAGVYLGGLNTIHSDLEDWYILYITAGTQVVITVNINHSAYITIFDSYKTLSKEFLINRLLKIVLNFSYTTSLYLGIWLNTSIKSMITYELAVIFNTLSKNDAFSNTDAHQTFSEALSVDLNTTNTIVGSLISPSDKVDIYKFNLSSNTLFMLRIIIWPFESQVNVFIYDANGSCIGSYQVIGKLGVSLKINYTGSYYLLLMTDCSTFIKYKIYLSVVPQEYENDANTGTDAGENRSQAIQLSAGSYNGTLIYMMDETDWYVAVLYAGSLWRIAIHPQLNTSIRMLIYGENGGIFCDSIVNDSYYFDIDVINESIVIYIQLELKAGELANYIISIEQLTLPQNDAGTGFDAGEDPRDSTTLSSGSFSGTLYPRVDVIDVFSIDLAYESELLITVSILKGINNIVKIVIYDHNLNIIDNKLLLNNVATFSLRGFAGEKIYISLILLNGTVCKYSIDVSIKQINDWQYDAGLYGDAGDSINYSRNIYDGTFSGVLFPPEDLVDFYRLPIDTICTLRIVVISNYSTKLDVALYNQSNVIIGSNTTQQGLATIILNIKRPAILYVSIMLGDINKISEVIGYFLKIIINPIRIVDAYNIDAGNSMFQATKVDYGVYWGSLFKFIDDEDWLYIDGLSGYILLITAIMSMGDGIELILLDNEGYVLARKEILEADLTINISYFMRTHNRYYIVIRLLNTSYQSKYFLIIQKILPKQNDANISHDSSNIFEYATCINQTNISGEVWEDADPADWYYISVPTNRQVYFINISFWTREGVFLELYSENLSKIATLDANSNVTLPIKENISKIYLKVSSQFAGGKYRITISFGDYPLITMQNDAGLNTDAPNNASKAVELNINATFSGLIVPTYDNADWYKININTDGMPVKLRFEINVTPSIEIPVYVFINFSNENTLIIDLTNNKTVAKEIITNSSYIMLGIFSNASERITIRYSVSVYCMSFQQYSSHRNILKDQYIIIILFLAIAIMTIIIVIKEFRKNSFY